MQISPLSGAAAPAAPSRPHCDNIVLMDRARDLEAAFLSEMLANAGLGAMPDSGFGGGIGEEQFASFLRQEQARQMVERGGIGLAEHLFHAMTRRDQP